ncbi:MAG: hypothetical protein HRT66_00675 [Flavobacteriaceae bacterium]|nr:hypothetical protein [Flavobacteriaceae bacterium]
MANIKTLKKNIHFVLGGVLDACYITSAINPKDNETKCEAISDDAIVLFDSLIDRVGAKKVENKKQHFKSIEKDLEVKATELVDRLNAV